MSSESDTTKESAKSSLRYPARFELPLRSARALMAINLGVPVGIYSILNGSDDQRRSGGNIGR